MAAPSVSSVSTETRLCVLVVRVVTAAWAGVAVHLAASWPSLAQVQLQEAAWAQVLPTLATSAQLAAALSLLVFIIGEITGNVSSVDRDQQTYTRVFLKQQTRNVTKAQPEFFCSHHLLLKLVSRMYNR